MCSNVKNTEQVERIIAMVETLKDPETLAIHVGHDILYNGVDLEHNINECVKAFQNKAYQTSG